MRQNQKCQFFRMLFFQTISMPANLQADRQGIGLHKPEETSDIN